jgi:hypothetical protein
MLTLTAVKGVVANRVGACHRGITRQVAEGGEGLQIWRVAANVLKKQSLTADNG